MKPKMLAFLIQGMAEAKGVWKSGPNGDTVEKLVNDLLTSGKSEQDICMYLSELADVLCKR